MRLSEDYELILARTGLFDLKYEICVKLVNLHSTEKKLPLSRSHWCHESIDGKRCGNKRNVEINAET